MVKSDRKLLVKDSHKRSSLLRQWVNYEEKKFYKFVPNLTFLLLSFFHFLPVLSDGNFPIPFQKNKKKDFFPKKKFFCLFLSLSRCERDNKKICFVSTRVQCYKTFLSDVCNKLEGLSRRAFPA